MEDNKMEFVPARASEIVRDYVAAAEKGEKPTKLQELMFSPAENVEHATERLGSTVEFIIDLYQAALLEAGIRAKAAAEFKAAFDRTCADNTKLANENLKLREEKKELNIRIARAEDRLNRTIEERIRRWFE